jgi:hypothetical protein
MLRLIGQHFNNLKKLRVHQSHARKWGFFASVVAFIPEATNSFILAQPISITENWLSRRNYPNFKTSRQTLKITNKNAIKIIFFSQITGEQ